MAYAVNREWCTDAGSIQRACVLKSQRNRVTNLLNGMNPSQKE